jgi:hypothetical protein
MRSESIEMLAIRAGVSAVLVPHRDLSAMSRPKTLKHSTKTTPISTTPIPTTPTSSSSNQGVLAPDAEVDGLGIHTVTAPQQRTLGRAMRFLVSIQSPDYLHRARREGYSAAEHGEGWRLWRTATGQDRPFEQLLTEQVSARPDHLAVLQRIDTFENTWFPRTRAIIRRVVPADRREQFADAFFQNLEQQPLGPSVVGSVSTYLARVDGLAKAADPAAKAVHEMLAKRGLTEESIQQMRKLLALFEGPEAARAPAAVGSSKAAGAAAIENAQRAQLEAFEGLRDWFNDWATTLRGAYNLRERIQLGLATMKRRSAAGEEVTEEAESTEEEEGNQEEEEGEREADVGTGAGTGGADEADARDIA